MAGDGGPCFAGDGESLVSGLGGADGEGGSPTLETRWDRPANPVRAPSLSCLWSLAMGVGLNKPYATPLSTLTLAGGRRFERSKEA